MIGSLNGTYSVVLAPQSVTAGATVTANFDTLGADYATLLISHSAGTHTNASTAAISVLHSDNTNATTFATVASDITRQQTASNVLFYGVAMQGKKRYLRLSYSAGTHSTSAVVVSAVGLLTRKESGPNTNTAVADYANIVV